ncbi:MULTISPECIES: bifunctional diguanylate cyclase/phosphodiesterase [unclassified Ectothiorhodospira]|uniref:putative bifunctional diguanylate cyclase/phosphodiesterase n=1 Tax=unclassified Ectothiorhodospira TaxID=2684909 RepID=UPI001EE7A1F3|nr:MULTISPECIES: bifunctional diguanylate cyclase/phosphodiesterase [unclassified Ectothiorhodospira]MCG5516580.1 EAL domain-containing protein [Ectothiorhodospira sp. 9100]MCG5519825.1 EAL domain-containing protein [Ectothiorhodospira sp. 9905]
MRKRLHPSAGHVVLIYALIAGVWIIASGWLLEWALENGTAQVRLEIVKGLLFVLVTSTLLYGLLRSWAHRLEDSERLMNMATSLAHVGGWQVDLHKGVVHWSQEVCRIHDMPAGTTVKLEEGIKFYAPGHRDRMREVFRACAEDGMPFDEEMQILTRQGTSVWVRTIGRAVRDEHGRITQVQGALQDISSRKRDEAKLRQWATVFESSGEGMIITDQRARILTVNAAFTRITGYGREEVVRHNPRLLASGRHTRLFYRRLWDMISLTGGWRGELWNRRKNGELYPQWTTINAVRDAEGRLTHFVSVFSDISDLKSSQEQIERLAHRDPLTNLPNRLLFRTRLEQALLRARSHAAQVSVLLLDLDGFKHINDSLGIRMGDQLLSSLAERLTTILQRGETLARMGGDEFAILVEQGADEETRVEQLAEAIIQAVQTPIKIRNNDVFITVSIGIARFPQDGREQDQLLQHSDAAMHHAKQAGGNTYAHYTQDLTDYARDRVLLAADLRQALERNELVLHYQPQVDLISGVVVGLEALVRWEHPTRGMISPGRFIPMAEDTGLILPLGRWVLRQACVQARAWQEAGLHFGTVAVNVSGVQVQRSDLVETVAAVLRETGLNPALLELEITESFVMDRRQGSEALLRQLKSLGVILAVDDFGTGYSSLSYLKSLPFDALKIDQSFIRGISLDPHDAAIASAITTLGGHLNMEVLAEGVETPEQQEALLALGCHRAQGYRFSHPVAAKAIPGVLRRPSLIPEESERNGE